MPKHTDLKKLEEDIHLLLRECGQQDGIALDVMKYQYQKRFHGKLNPKRFGFSSLRDLLAALQHVDVKETKAHHYRATALSTSQLNPTTSEQNEEESESEVNQRSRMPKLSFKLIESLHQLEELIALDTLFLAPDFDMVAIGCEGAPDNLFLIQVASSNATYIFDCVKIDPKVVCKALEPLFSNTRCLKLLHDLHSDVVALTQIGGIEPLSFENVLDTQLVLEHLTGQVFTGFNAMLQHFGQQPHPNKHHIKKRLKQGGGIFAQRPLSSEILQCAADDVALLIKISPRMRRQCELNLKDLTLASGLRTKNAIENDGARGLCFDAANGFEFASSELMSTLRPKDALQPSKLEVHHDLGDLFALLPSQMAATLEAHKESLSDIALDFGEEPIAWALGKRLRLGEDGSSVSLEDLDQISQQLGQFGTDNRAGIERQLHRISAIRNREKRVIGLTLRAGRHVTGNTYMITDLLFAHKGASILFLGEPGSGKTTIVREACRILSAESNVFIVDTSNEIAGDGDIKHPCVGQSRRMMVPSLDQQSKVMIECVQNHTPEIMVIDEIGRSMEVEAAQTCKNRGVRLIASAHGDLRGLVKNTKLRGLVGGVQSVTLGDEQAKEEAKKRGRSAIQKTKAERAGPPIFDIICEVKRGSHNLWTIIMNTGDAVDKILEGEEYNVQKRGRNPDTGSIHMSLSVQ